MLLYLPLEVGVAIANACQQSRLAELIERCVGWGDIYVAEEDFVRFCHFDRVRTESGSGFFGWDVHGRCNEEYASRKRDKC